MKISNSYASLMVLAAVVALERKKVSAFVPPAHHRAVVLKTKDPFASTFATRMPVKRKTTLKMVSDDFNESKYTEAAWGAVNCLIKVADFYQASSVDAPLLLEVMLNPSKHGAGEDAEAAKRVVDKVLAKAGANVSQLRSDLEKYLAKQVKVSGDTQQSMGRSLQKVLEAARMGKAQFGVSHCCICWCCNTSGSQNLLIVRPTGFFRFDRRLASGSGQRGQLVH